MVKSATAAWELAKEFGNRLIDHLVDGLAVSVAMTEPAQ